MLVGGGSKQRSCVGLFGPDSVTWQVHMEESRKLIAEIAEEP
ncbi:uncharacterized protein (DUF2236 family) [Embleya sp. AB8]